MSDPVYRRTVPDPLPIEPYFQKIPGSEVFLRAISEEPLEDLHRLAFADWLEEQGREARGDFIRLQCQAERFPEGHPASSVLREHSRVLLKRNAKEWLADLPRYPKVAWRDGNSFHRGMLEQATINSTLTARGYETLFKTVDVRQLVLRSRNPSDLGAGRERPWLSRLTALEVSPWWWAGNFDSFDLSGLLCVPEVKQLKRLVLAGHPLER
jgi:uncharacterized protein (TIGR02996 family)